jgi:hypothetical protein
LLCDDVFADEIRNILRSPRFNLFLTQTADRRFPLFRWSRNGTDFAGTLDAASRLFAETNATGPGATASGATEAFGVASDSRDFALFFSQDFVETADRFLECFFQPCFAFGLTLAGILPDTTRLTLAIVGRPADTVGAAVVFCAFLFAVKTARPVCSAHRSTHALDSATTGTTAGEAPPDAPPEAPPDAPPEAPPDAPPEAPPDAPPEAPPDMPPEEPPDMPPDEPPDDPPDIPPEEPPDMPPDEPPDDPPEDPPEDPPDMPPDEPPEEPPEDPPDMPPDEPPEEPPEDPPEEPPEDPPDMPPDEPPDEPPDMPPDMPPLLE